MQSIRKWHRFGCLSSPCLPTWYQNRSRRRVSTHGCTCNHRSRLSTVCIPAFRILYLPRPLSPLYVTSLLALILKHRRQRLGFTLTVTTRIPALATVPMRNLLQWAPRILRHLHLHHPNARPPVSLLLT